ncbi:25S rRNA (uridine(2843)-N(3))-methyltransferase-like protein [Elsinoe fawcettii]|nr:25S rRNA (uridine(2843)-N(3))-methyltransferase-like protein [Elsinoe fawcettii]
MAKGKGNRSDKKKADSPQSSRDAQSQHDQDGPSEESAVSLKLQQHVLNIFRDACAEPLGSDLEPVIQKVKQHLYNRDFTGAFGSDPHLWAYAARWSPSRALAYLQIFQDISPFVTDGERTTPAPTNESGLIVLSVADGEVRINNALPPPYTNGAGPSDAEAKNARLAEKKTGTIVDKPPGYDEDAAVPGYEHPPSYGAHVDLPQPAAEEVKPGLRIACLGGGAGAELVASAAWLRLHSATSSEDADTEGDEHTIDPDSLDVCCVDIANWASVVLRLDEAIKKPPAISKYASAVAKAANISLLPAEGMTSKAIQQDLLDANLDCIRPLFQTSDLVTMMFTLNELYSTSVSKTQRLLFELTVATSPGALFLVVDSPGSYSTVTLNGTEKRYPMSWLLDHTLLEASRNTRILPRGKHWQKVLSDDSRWFRLPKGLQYPIELENMRYQIHLYRRLGVGEDPTASGPSLAR